MNIEQIAQEVAVEIDPLQRKLQGDFQFSEKQLSEFLRRCLNKLAEQDVEPVAYTCNHALYRLKPCSSINGHPVIPLYTKASLIAAQQKAAEACAKLLNDNLGHLTRGDSLEAIRNGAWREYL